MQGLRLSELQSEIHCSIQADIMLTPSFDTQQNEEFVVLNIRVPYVKISEAEFHISGRDFKFYCKPYFLRLHLPGEVVEDGREKASYNVDSGTIVVHLPKRNRGEHFENLDMLTTLLSGKTPSTELSKMGSNPLIEVMGADTSGAEASSCPQEEDEEEFEWQMEQQLPNKEEEEIQLIGAPCYGFASQHKGVFSKLQEEVPSIVDCPDPDHMTPHERRVARIAHEETSFDAEYYLADLMDNDSIDGLLRYEPPWREELARWRRQKAEVFSSATAVPSKSHTTEPGQEILPFSAEERDHLKELPSKEYLLDKASRRILYLGLVDIIFAFAYNYRITLGEGNCAGKLWFPVQGVDMETAGIIVNDQLQCLEEMTLEKDAMETNTTVESAWTICKLSSTLSWLEVFRGSVHEVVYCSLRRSLCYPLYRHWQLAQAVLQDTRDLFHLGRRRVLQCLLAIRRTLNSSEPYYILNNLYITDYCVWIQKASTRQIHNLVEELDEVKVDITSLGWDLVELEQAALLVVAEEKENRMEEVTHEHGNESKASGDVSAISASQEEHHEKCTASREINVDACNEAKSTPEKSAETLSDFSEQHSQPVAHEQLGAVTLTASEHSCKQIQNLSAKLEKLLTLDPPVGLVSHCKPLIEEVRTALPPSEQQDETSSACSTCSTCSSDSDTTGSEKCSCEGPAN